MATEQRHAETKEELTSKLAAATKKIAVLNVALEEGQEKATQEKVTSESNLKNQPAVQN